MLDGSRTLAALKDSATIERGRRRDSYRPRPQPRRPGLCAGLPPRAGPVFSNGPAAAAGRGRTLRAFRSALTVPMDRESRQHGFRRRVAEVLAGDDARPDPPGSTPTSAGVNAGLAALGARPWEYLALRATPRPWTREDCVLVADAMSMTLESDGSDERSRLAIAQTYGEEALEFPAPARHRTQRRPRRLQRPRAARARRGPPDRAAVRAGRRVRPCRSWRRPSFSPFSEALPGSNSFALSGARTAGGGALVANDPHLQPMPCRTSGIAPRSSCPTWHGHGCHPARRDGDRSWAATATWHGDSRTATSTPATSSWSKSIRPISGRYRVPDGNGWEAFEVVRRVHRRPRRPRRRPARS